MKITNNNGLLIIGIGHKQISIDSQYSFKNYYRNIGHGYYLIRSDGTYII